jgi:hypothetical protein
MGELQPIADGPDYLLPGRGQVGHTVSAFLRTGAGRNTSKFKHRVRPASVAGPEEMFESGILCVVARFYAMARYGQVEHPLCQLGVAQRVFSVVAGSARKGAALGTVPSLGTHAVYQTFFFFFIFGIFIKIAESNHFYIYRNTDH